MDNLVVLNYLISSGRSGFWKIQEETVAKSRLPWRNVW
jgi:hypothetical protein